MAKTPPTDPKDLKALRSRVDKIEDYLFGGGPGGPGYGSLPDQLKKIRDELRKLDAKSITQDDLDRVIERINALADQKGDKPGGLTIPHSG